MPVCMEVGLSPCVYVLDGDPVPLPERGQPPQFSAHVYSAETAAWIKMPLGMEVCVGLCNIVLDEDSAPPG